MRLSFAVIAVGVGLLALGRGVLVLLAGLVVFTGEWYLQKQRDAATERARLARLRYEEKYGGGAGSE